ncbi:hypothetical protein GOE04_11560 [Sinorhizobium medicae]|uniref:hypothetical protein n=1 Tax=Sinorhizobium medicae TaxID=110321 RepID=UPI001AADDC44|nr:hypothetical protein [Sinorhizobium medicae]MBO1943163.1 hypothetical protein [Sinorhizobium medicae]MDX0921805.1 hypothetical protein [Sinorhizobium medicae]MDX0926669.1 hypothetical protein [Sinorhizobium medicae]MDX0934109.1 hypothetical protein [Sinorhizobium medicae]MDX0940311.1 hypothetical protein [Sinorhizobium medicae]
MPVGTPTLATPQIGATAASVTTASFTPTANALLIAFCAGRGSSATIPTISDSLGGTWTPIGTGNDAGNVTGRLFYQVAGASPSAMTVTVNTTGGTQAAVGVIEVSGAGTDFSNYQVGINAAGDPSVTMGAYTAGSRVMVFGIGNAGAAWTSPTGFTELFDSEVATNLRLVPSYNDSSASTSLSWVSTATDSIGFGLEIKEAAAGAISGSASITEAADTVSALSAIGITGAASLSEEGDALVASGSVVSGIAGTLSVTEASDTVAATATIALRASLAASEGSDSVSTSAKINLAAAASLVESADTVSATGTIASASRSGSADITEAGDTLASAAVISLKASASVTEEGDTLSTIAGPVIVGSASLAEAGDTITARAVPLLVSSPQERTASVPAEDRTAAVASEIRAVAIKAEVRTAAARAETRRAAA